MNIDIKYKKLYEKMYKNISFHNDTPYNTF